MSANGKFRPNDRKCIKALKQVNVFRGQLFIFV